MTRSISLVAWPGNGRTHPPLWDVEVNDTPIPGGRVLKMGRTYLPILDGNDFSIMTRASTKLAAARMVVDRYEGR